MIIQNNADNTFIPCYLGKEGKCYIYYQKRYTPMLHDIIPNEIYHERELTYKINP